MPLTRLVDCPLVDCLKILQNRTQLNVKITNIYSYSMIPSLNKGKKGQINQVYSLVYSRLLNHSSLSLPLPAIHEWGGGHVPEKY